MRKIYTFFAVVVFCCSGLAQELKIKKDRVIINDQEVAVITGENRLYTLKGITGTPVFTAAIKNKTLKGRETSQHWIELKDQNDFVHEIDLKLKSINMNLEKRVVESLVEEGFLTAKGIDESKFISGNTTFSTQLDNILEEFEKAYATEDKIANDSKLVINNGKNGIYEITADFVLIGYIIGKSVPDPKDSNRMRSEYYVYDTAKQPIAALWFNSFDTGNELLPKYMKTFSDSKDHSIITKCKFYTLNKEPMAERMVKFLFANNYLKVEKKYQ